MSRHGCTSLSLEHEDVVKITSIKHCIGETGRQSPIITIHFFSLITLQDTAHSTAYTEKQHSTPAHTSRCIEERLTRNLMRRQSSVGHLNGAQYRDNQAGMEIED